MKMTVALLIILLFTNAISAMEGVTEDKCYPGSIFRYEVVRKIDSKHFEMFSPNPNGAHAILERKGSGTYTPGPLPNVMIKNVGSKSMKLKNGFNGKVELFVECTEIEAKEEMEKFNANHERHLQLINNLPKEKIIYNEDKLNSCVSICNGKYTGTDRDPCYLECDKATGN